MLKKLPFRGYVYSALALDLIAVLTVFLVKNNLPPVVPLLYGRPAGNEQLISTYGLILAPIAAAIITIMNIFLASYIKDEFIKKVFSVASLFVSVLATITVIKIVLLVGFW
jgi:hypothetical protein